MFLYPALLAAVALAVGLWLRIGALVATSLALAATEYAAYLLLRADAVDAAAPVYAAALLLVGELGYGALEPAAARPESAVRVRRGLTLAAAVGGAALAGLVILAASSVGAGAGLGVRVIGFAAAAAALALVARLVWRQARRP